MVRGKLGCAWVGLWVVHGWMMWWGWDKCGGILPELVRLDLSIGGDLVGDVLRYLV